MVSSNQFNQVVEAFIDFQAVRKTYDNEVNHELAESWYQIQKSIKVMNQTIQECDGRITALNGRVHENFSHFDYIMLKLQRALAASDLASLESTSNATFNHPLFNRYLRLASRYAQAQKTFEERFLEAYQAAHKEAPQESRFEYLLSKNYSRTIQLLAEELNITLDTGFEYTLDAEGLIAKIQKVVEHAYWDQIGPNRKCGTAVKKIRAIIVQSDLNPDDRLSKIINLATQALKGSNSPDKRQLFQAISNKKLISLAYLAEKTAVFTEFPDREPTAYQSLHTELTTDPLSEAETEFSHLALLFAKATARMIAALKLLEQAAPLLEELKNAREAERKLNENIEQNHHQQEYKKAAEDLEKRQKEVEAANLNDPRLLGQLDLEADSLITQKKILPALRRIDKKQLAFLRQQLNRKFNESAPLVLQATTALSEADLWMKLLIKALKERAKTSCGEEQVPAWFSLYIFAFGYKFAYLNDPLSLLRKVCGDERSFVISYSEMNSKICDALRNPLWKDLNPHEGTAEPIQELIQLTVKKQGRVSPEKLFEKVQTFCKDRIAQQENSLFFWVKPTHPEVTRFLKAIVEQDIVGIFSATFKQACTKQMQKTVSSLSLS